MLMFRPQSRSSLFPYTTLFRSELLEAVAFDAAEQVLRLHLEAVEGDLVFLHAAIAEHLDLGARHAGRRDRGADRKSTRLNSSHANISYAVFCLKKKKQKQVRLA